MGCANVSAFFCLLPEDVGGSASDFLLLLSVASVLLRCKRTRIVGTRGADTGASLSLQSRTVSLVEHDPSAAVGGIGASWKVVLDKL